MRLSAIRTRKPFCFSIVFLSRSAARLAAKKLEFRFLAQGASEAGLGDLRRCRKTQAKFGDSRPACPSAPFPLPYPSLARITKASANTNDVFALCRGFYRILYRAARLHNFFGPTFAPNAMPNATPSVNTCLTHCLTHDDAPLSHGTAYGAMQHGSARHAAPCAPSRTVACVIVPASWVLRFLQSWRKAKVLCLRGQISVR